jgi:1,4-dihydroxy-2-naphthoate octaprenyltransferase
MTAVPDTTPRPSSAQIWLLAIRPRTLGAAFAPVFVGTALAADQGGFHLLAALAALWGAVWLQIGTNFANDLFDFQKGADTEARLGPTRVTQAGLVSPSTMRIATIAAYALVLPAAVYLAVRGGAPLFLLALVSIAAGVLYTGGPRPYGYAGLGDVFVLVFFGPVAVAGTTYVQTLELQALPAFVGLFPGFLATAMLAVNNLRDEPTDRGVGKQTLAVRFGPGFARREIAVLLALAQAIVIGAAVWTQHGWALLALVPGAVLIPGILRTVWREQGAALNPMLGAIGKLLLLECAAFAVGWMA